MAHEAKIDELVLALMSLNKFNDGKNIRTWKNYIETSITRLEQKNYIQNHPQTQSVLLTTEGLIHAEACFKKHILNHG